MKNYNASDIQSYFDTYSKHIQFIVVAHTKVKTYNLSKQVQDERVQKACYSLQHGFNVLDKLLRPAIPNYVVRKPNMYRTLKLVTVEGLDNITNRDMTLHFNICLGNVPDVLTLEELKLLFEHTWNSTLNQGAFEIYDIRQQGTGTWNGYSLKEAQQDKSKSWDTHGTWAVQNCWIPHDALAAD